MTVRSTPRRCASAAWLPGSSRAAATSTWYPRWPPGMPSVTASAALTYARNTTARPQPRSSVSRSPGARTASVVSFPAGVPVISPWYDSAAHKIVCRLDYLGSSTYWLGGLAMADYGHDLSFGIFVTPQADAGAHVIELARRADTAGLDWVSVQDHPYQPAFLDAWTLPPAFPPATAPIGVFPNVATLPLRPPAMLARAAASLDILSGGRVELGLGTGAFWDAIAAMGGPRRTAGESVDALREAIAVIRALWTPGS